MKAKNTSSVKNIVLLGHTGSGKTSLVETMLYESGTIRRRGSVKDHNTVSDFHPIEVEKL
ncbi:MAG: GTP-binding protein, partial [Balneolaceae bacterium]